MGVVLTAAPLVSLAAQESQTATVRSSGGWFYDAPSGKRIGRLEQGAELELGERSGAWQSVTLRGVIWARSVGRASEPGYDLRVTQRGEENLRDRPNGTVLARLLEGFLLERAGSQGNWVEVERQGWVDRTILETTDPATDAPPADDGTAAEGAVTAARVVRGAALRARPEGDTLALFPDSASVQVLERNDRWVRVRVDGWLRAGELGAVAAEEAVTPADLRSDPERYRGALVRWPLQVIAVRTADELRPDIPTGQRYLLTRGPLPEGEFVYVILPDDRVAEAELLRPLATVVVTGRVHTARARYLGNAVLELVALETGAQR